MAQLLKKISVRTCYGSKTDILAKCMKDRDIEHPLIRVIGFATGTRTAKSRDAGDDGEKIVSTGLVGEIECVNLETGEVFNSAVAWLPQMATDLVAGQFGGDDEAERIGFAFDIGVRFNEKAATSYEFTVQPLMELQPTDAMAELKKSLPTIETKKALASPTKK